MPIHYHEASREFHLCNEQISYIFTILRNGQLGQIYYGKRLRERDSYQHLIEYCRRAQTSYLDERTEHAFALEHLKQEYPSYGSGDMHYPAFELQQADGGPVTDFQYVSHRIYHGKPKLDGLPATYTEQDSEAQTLEITLRDSVIQTKLILTYTIFESFPVITRNAKFVCEGGEGIVLTKAMSMSIDFPDMDFEMLELTGAWARERNVHWRKLDYGAQSIHSMRGASSSYFNPFIALKRPGTTEHSGEVYGFSLVYSGNFLAQAEVDTYDVTRVTMGIHPMRFSWPLRAGEEFQTPEAVMVYSCDGLNGMSQAYHKLYRTRLAKGEWRDRPRPILINNWEATYFDFNEEKIMRIAETAKRLGVELFVLDDGWFGKRNDDTSSLGDWFPNLDKLPNGIKGIAEKIEQAGLKFGLWFEPEMVNEDSELYRAHPDWALHVPGRSVCSSRNQLVLDFSREEVVDAVGDMMERVLSDAPVSYVKWDMNRNMSEVYSCGADAAHQGMVFHKYILGVYRLYERLTQKFPHILFESCAGGGARFDPGILHYAPQGWTSDNSDAAERLKIQYGTSMVYPVSSMGAHVSAVPNHQMGRTTPLETRANVAYFGTFGYELDLNQLSETEQAEIVKQIEFMKKYRKLFQQGTFYRLLSPFEGNITAWMVVSEDKKTAILGYYRTMSEVSVPFRRVKLAGLDSKLLYRVSGDEQAHGGDELMSYGLITTDFAEGKTGDYLSRLYILEAE